MADEILMCEPRHYDVDYVINPWMEGNVHNSSHDLAREQWEKLRTIVAEHAKLKLVEPQKGWPDMVFTANAGMVFEDKAVLSRFTHSERQGEEPYFREWFESNGFKVHALPDDVPFEGAGDALLHREQNLLWAGHGFRSDIRSHAMIAEWLGIDVVSIRLTDPRFYHLDTCFCPLNGGYLLYFPPALDADANAKIEAGVPAEFRIAIKEEDALHFACNAVNIGSTVIVNQASEALKERMSACGFSVIETPLTEFLKAGGAAKCLTLRLNEARR